MLAINTLILMAMFIYLNEIKIECNDLILGGFLGVGMGVLVLVYDLTLARVVKADLKSVP